MKKLKISKKDAYILWDYGILAYNNRIMNDLFYIAFPKGTRDKAYKHWVEVEEGRKEPLALKRKGK